MTMPVAVLAGGLATRLRPVTEQIPKALVEVAGRPFAEHQIALLARNGVTDLLFLVGHLGEMVREQLGDGARFGVRIRYAFDGPKPLGTGGAILAALPRLADPFFVLYGDSYLECDYGAVERAFRGGAADGLMTVCENHDRWDRSNVRFVNGRIEAYDKTGAAPGMRHIDYGLGAFRKAAFTGRAEGEAFDLAALYGELLVEGRLQAFDVPGRFYEIGSPAGLEETRAHLSARSQAS